MISFHPFLNINTSSIKTLLLFVGLFFHCSIGFSQSNWSSTSFKQMSSKERFNYVHSYPFWKVTDFNELSKIHKEMLSIAESQNDKRTSIAIKYHSSLASQNANYKIPFGKTFLDLIEEIIHISKKEGFIVEEIIANYHYQNHQNWQNQKTYYQKQYIAVKHTFEKMKEIGFDQFKNYYIENQLFYFGKFMWELEDYEQAYIYLSIAEKYIKPTEEGAHFYTLVNNYLQEYWKKRKDYDRAIIYAKNILDFHTNKLQNSNAHPEWWSDFWKGFANIEIAGFLIKKGKLQEGEVYANKGYLLSKSKQDITDLSSFFAEFDALQVLIPIKLKLKKEKEYNALIERSLFLKNELKNHPSFDYFKPLSFYKNLTNYYEFKNDANKALKYSKLAQDIQDSLTVRNDAKKIQKIQQRLDAEKYAKKIQQIEEEKQKEQLIRNVILVLMLIVILFAIINYRHLLFKRQQKEFELKNTKINLDKLTEDYKEKSDLAEKLNSENKKLIDEENKTKYLKELTKSTILTDEDWSNFKLTFNKIHPNYISKLQADFPKLTKAEIRVLVLDKLELSLAQISNMLGVNKNTIHQTRRRIRKKTDA